MEKIYNVGRVSVVESSTVIIDFGVQETGVPFTITTEQMSQLLSEKPPIVQVTINNYQINLYRFDKISNAAFYTNVMYFNGRKYYINMSAQGTQATIISLDELEVPAPSKGDSGKVLTVSDNGIAMEWKEIISTTFGNIGEYMVEGEDSLSIPDMEPIKFTYYYFKGKQDPKTINKTGTVELMPGQLLPYSNMAQFNMLYNLAASYYLTDTNENKFDIKVTGDVKHLDCFNYFSVLKFISLSPSGVQNTDPLDFSLDRSRSDSLILSINALGNECYTSIQSYDSQITSIPFYISKRITTENNSIFILEQELNLGSNSISKSGLNDAFINKAPRLLQIRTSNKNLVLVLTTFSDPIEENGSMNIKTKSYVGVVKNTGGIQPNTHNIYTLDIDSSGSGETIGAYLHRVSYPHIPSTNTAYAGKVLGVNSSGIYDLMDPVGGGGGEVTKDSIAKALNITTDQLDLLAAMSKNINSVTASQIKFNKEIAAESFNDIGV